MGEMKITDSIRYIGADDKTIDLFESQYPVPQGVTYNSYLILDEKVAVMDTVDQRATGAWLKRLEAELAGREPDYLVVSHMEPDHAANIQTLALRYPNMKIVANAKTFPMMGQFFAEDFAGRAVTVAEGETLSLGAHTLQFFMAPMVHWPEVMVTYEQSEKILFSADGFGTFGASGAKDGWDDEARRYFINIVGKYGPSVQALLKKVAGLDVRMICPLHGPVLEGDLGHYIGKYQTWSSYEPEKEGILVAYASIHGNTKFAAEQMRDILLKEGAKEVVLRDLAREDVSYAVSDAFCYPKMVLASATYDAGLFPCMEDFLNHLKAKNYQKRTVALIENGSWAPAAARLMKQMLEKQKEVEIVEPVVTIRSSVKADNVAAMEELAKKLVG